jgi:hypothetical protein
MAGKAGSQKVFFYFDGYNGLASGPQTLSHKVESVTEKVDGLGDAYEAHAPVGMTKITLTQGGAFFDTATGGSHAALLASPPTTPQTAARTAVLGFSGDVAGEAFYGIEGDLVSAYEVMGTVGALTKANATHTTTGQTDRGVVLQPLATKSADWNTKSLGTQVDGITSPWLRTIPITSNSQASPTVVTTTVPHGLTSNHVIVISGNSGSNATINGERTVTVISPTTFSIPVNCTTSGGTGGTFLVANSLSGGAGYLEVTACSGFTNFVAKIRHSSDDSTYADLITFTDNVSAPFAERKTVSGTVHRYLCVDGDTTGTGSVTAWVGFARS